MELLGKMKQEKASKGKNIRSGILNLTEEKAWKGKNIRSGILNLTEKNGGAGL